MTGKFLQFFVLPFSQKSISLFCLTTLLDVFRTYLMHSSKYFCLHDLNTFMLLQGFAEALTGVSFKRTTKYVKETAIRMISIKLEQSANTFAFRTGFSGEYYCF